METNSESRTAQRKLEIQSAQESHYSRICNLAELGGLSYWTENDYRKLNNTSYGAVLVALWREETAQTPDVLGYIAFHSLGSEVEILSLAVAAEARRRGIGRRLLNAAEARARKNADSRRTMLLEVRATNSGAVGFYASMGFVATGRRSAYYRQPVEDALVMVKKI